MTAAVAVAAAGARRRRRHGGGGGDGRSRAFSVLLFVVLFFLGWRAATWELDSALFLVVCLWSVNVGKPRHKSVPTH
jgi:hypothetical protein